MSVFRSLIAPAASVAGNVVAGYAKDREKRVAEVLAERQQAETEKRNRMMEAIAGRSYDPRRGAVVDIASNTASPTAGLPDLAPAAPPQTVTPGTGVWNAETKTYDVPIPKETAEKPPRNIDPLSEEGINASIDRARQLQDVIRSAPPRPTPPLQERRQAETDALSAVQASGGDLGRAEALLVADPKSPWRKESMETRVRFLKAAGDRYAREKEMDKYRAGVWGMMGPGGAPAGGAPPAPSRPAPPSAASPDAEITDEEIVEAMTNGAETEEAVREYVMKKRAGGGG